MRQTLAHIAGRPIGPGQPPYVVAEMSGNHNGDIRRALDLITAAAEAGADAVKIQTYTADTITLDHDGPGFRIEGGLWEGRRLHELYAEAHTPWDWPLVMSTGMASPAEIGEAVETARQAGARDLIVLHCTSAYPAPMSSMNLVTLPDMAERFGVMTGLSDHTLGTAASVAAVALGAVFIEKHFTLSRAEGGVDSAFSLEPAELADLVRSCRGAWEALRSVRPGFGLPPKHLDAVLGRRATRDIPFGEPLDWSMVEGGQPG